MNKPVFIIGCPRSGTTILLDLLSAHESFAWISDRFNQSPKKILWNYHNRIYDIPYLGRNLFLKKGLRRVRKLLPQSVEPWAFWDNYLSNFQWKRRGQTPPRRRTENDITFKEVSNLRKIIQLVCKYQNKGRFLSKYTDFPRIKYLIQVFPDAQFIHLLRDGRAVSYSYYNKIKSRQFKTWEEREWWIRGWPKLWCKSWEEKHNSPLGLAAYQWKFFVKEIWEDSKYLASNQYLEIRYEGLVNSPEVTIRKVLKFCSLEFTPRIKWYINHTIITNMNYKWKKYLDKKQQKELETIIVEDQFRKLFEF